MFMRLVEATVKKDGDAWLERVYADSILHALEQTPGCIFAGLLYSMDHTSRYMSLTLWESETHAQHYVNSGEFKKNLDRLRPVLEESSEWKIQLSKENTVEYKEVPFEPVVKSWDVSDPDSSLPGEVHAQRSYLRILSHKINPGNAAEFTRIYNSEVLPELRAVPGCRYAFLIDNSETDREMISFSIWDDPALLEHYERQGKFKELLDKLSHTLGDLYQWKMALEKRSKSAVATVTSQDIGVSRFTLVTGKKFI